MMAGVGVEDLEVLEALRTLVSGDASGGVLAREVRQQLGWCGAPMQRVSGALGRLEDAGLAAPVSRGALPRGGSQTKLWAPTAAGWAA